MIRGAAGPQRTSRDAVPEGEARFDPATERLLDRAATFCEGRDTRLTPVRREVLGLVLEGDRPVGAYDLLDRLRAFRRGAAPPTVYRALDFLLEHGLIHRIERLSAFIGCVHEHDGPGHSHQGGAQFLLCRSCGRTVELEEAAITAALKQAALSAGYSFGGATVEIEGMCAECRAAEPSAPAAGPA